MFGIDLKGVPFKEVKIGEICEMRNRGSDYYKSSEIVGPHEGAMIIQPPNIVNNKLYFDDVQYYSWTGYNKKPDLNIQIGDILLVKMAAVGAPFKSAVVTELPEPAITNSSIHIFKNIKCNPTYLQLIISSAEFQRQLKASQTGSGSLFTIKQSTLLEMPILLPPMEYQNRIGEELLNYRENNNALIQALEKEIQMRKKQYDWISDSILWHTSS